MLGHLREVDHYAAWGDGTNHEGGPQGCRGTGAVRFLTEASLTPEHRLPGPSGQLRNGRRPFGLPGTVRRYDHILSHPLLLLPYLLGPKHKIITNNRYSTVIKNIASETNGLNLNLSSHPYLGQLYNLSQFPHLKWEY